MPSFSGKGQADHPRERLREGRQEHDLRGQARLGDPHVQGDGGEGAQGGGRFEIILPNARFMRDPLKHEGSKPLPMRILGQNSSKALPAPAQNLPYTADEASAKAKGSAKRDQTEPSGIVAKAIAAARGVSEVHRSPCSGGTATLILNGHLKTSQCESCPTREFCAAFDRD